MNFLGHLCSIQWCTCTVSGVPFPVEVAQAQTGRVGKSGITSIGWDGLDSKRVDEQEERLLT